jgi:predicted short-subunit dehydrogenase-like oxidoreductase (DUF2520 family)
VLRSLGEPVVAIAGRDPAAAQKAATFIGPDVSAIRLETMPARAQRILIAVPDDALGCVATTLADAWVRGGMGGGVALHTSGARGPEALTTLATQGVSCGAIHPLQTIANPEQGVTALSGIAFGITASGPALEWSLEIVRLLGGEALCIRAEQRTLYHAAAVFASNYVTGSLDAAGILMKHAGIEEAQAMRALAPLVRASVENALAMGPLRALTGPVERADSGTIAAHLTAVSGQAPSVRELYRSAGLHLVDMARRKHPETNLDQVEQLLLESTHVKGTHD